MIKKKKLLTIPVILSIIPISLSLNGIISNSPLIQKIDSNHNATTTTAATSTLVDQTTLLTAINADKIVQSNSFSGNFANLNLNPITVTVGGYYLFSSATPKENNLNFTLTNKNSVFIDNSQNDSTLKENILKNTNFQMDVNDWDLKNTTNFSLDNDKFTTYFDINNFKKIDSTITSSFYTLNTYSYNLVSKTNTSTTNGTTTLWSLTSQTFPRRKTAFFDFTIRGNPYSNAGNLSPNPTTTGNSFSYSTYKASDFLGLMSNYSSVKEIKINDVSIGKPSVFSVGIKFDYKYTGQYLQYQEVKSCSLGYSTVEEMNSSSWQQLPGERIDQDSYAYNVVVNIDYYIDDGTESLILNPNQQITNSSINNINTAKVVSSVSPEKLIALNLDSSNAATNNGLVWTTAPKLNFGFNQNILTPAYELFKLKTLYNQINSSLLDNSISTQKTESLINLRSNIKRLNNSYKNYQQQYDDLMNKNVVINFDSFPMLDIFTQYDKIQSIPDDINNWDLDWLVIQSILKDKTIVASYKTPASNEVKTQAIWDGKKFYPITATDNVNRNSNYISLVGLNYQPSVATEAKKLDTNKVYYDSKYTNVVNDTTNETLTYNFEYRSTALNLTNLYIDTVKYDLRSIQIPLGKYVSEVVYPIIL